MREQRNFAQRTKVLKTSEAKRKFFLVFEGAKTEGIYFEAVNKFRAQIAIDPLIEMIPLIRSYSEQDWSNPKKILDRVIRDVESELTGEILCETVLNRLMDYFIEEGLIATVRVGKKVVWEHLVLICKETLGYSLSDIVDDVEKLCQAVTEQLCADINFPKIIDDLTSIITDGGLGYEDGFDKICLVVDRDRDSFTESQYDLVLSKCSEKCIGFFVSNPCFEFWLLLHFDTVFDLDKEKLLSNPWITSSKRYTEVEAGKAIPRYTKKSYNADDLIKNIDKAINNEQRFCEDIFLLKDQLGSNIGKLITCLRENCDGSRFCI